MTNTINTTNFTYITATSKENEATQQFVMMPTFLFELPLSSSAKIFYAFLLDRCKLSKKNRWIDSLGRVYSIFPLKSIQNLLTCSKNTATKVLNELREIGLIETTKEKFGGATKIFVKYPVYPKSENPKKEDNNDTYDDIDSNNEIKKEENVPDTQVPNFRDILPNDGQNLNTLSQFFYDFLNFLPSLSQIMTPNHININHTNINHTNQSYLSDIDTDKIEQQKQEQENYNQKIKENIDYNSLIQQNICSQEQLDNIVDIMTDVMISQQKVVRINKQNISIEIVKNTFMQLTAKHIQYVFECLKTTAVKIKNVKAYLITTLYNSIKTIGLYHVEKDLEKIKQEEENKFEKKQYETRIKRNRFVNYEQRNWDFDELDRLQRTRLQNSCDNMCIVLDETTGTIAHDKDGKRLIIDITQPLPEGIEKRGNDYYKVSINPT